MEPVALNEEDKRAGLVLWLELMRIHDQYHAAEQAFGRWANATATLYGVGEGYTIGDPTIGFVPKQPQEGHSHA